MTSCDQTRSSNVVDDQASDKVVSILFEQQDCWNNGDIDCFMESYWNNDSLMFVSGERVSYGWQKVSDNYKSKYYSKELMGTLTFDIHKTEQLALDVILVIGSWDLKRADVNFGGKFSLLWRKIDGEWKIVIDHTS